MPTNTDDARNALKIRLAEIWARSRVTMLTRVAAIEAAASVLVAGGVLAADERRGVEREAHKVAGVAGSFGYPVGTDLAREAEQIVAGDAPIDHATALRLARVAAMLLEEFDGDLDTTTPTI